MTEPVPSPLGGGLIAIVRGRSGEHLDAVVDVLAESGILSLEITLNTPGAPAALRRAAGRLGPGVVVGAGTVRTVADARAALDAGARYLVSPHTDPAIGEVAREAGAAWLPGAFTPTEVVAACAAGADAVKLFPARLGGPRYLRDLREPLDNVAFVPTGGITAESIVDWFAAGAAAVGAGGVLIGDALATGDLAGLRVRAGRMLDALASVPR